MNRPVREILKSAIFHTDQFDTIEREIRASIAEELEGEKVIIDSNNRRVKWESYNDAISDCQKRIVNGGKVK